MSRGNPAIKRTRVKYLVPSVGVGKTFRQSEFSTNTVRPRAVLCHCDQHTLQNSDHRSPDNHVEVNGSAFLEYFRTENLVPGDGSAGDTREKALADPRKRVGGDTVQENLEDGHKVRAVSLWRKSSHNPVGQKCLESGIKRKKSLRARTSIRIGALIRAGDRSELALDLRHGHFPAPTAQRYYSSGSPEERRKGYVV